MTEPPHARKPSDGAPARTYSGVMCRDGIMLGEMSAGKPAAKAWATRLQGYVSAGELQELVSEQYAMDKDQSVQSRHAMAVPGQNPGQAKDAWESYVASKVDEAGQELTPDGNFTSAALRALGDAIHTLQDYTSPMHTSAGGDPQIWYGFSPRYWPHDLMHWAGESSPDRDWSAIGFAVRLTMAAFMQGNPKLATSEGLTDKTFNERANQRISAYASWYYSLPINGNADPMQEDAARLCALGNPAACL